MSCLFFKVTRSGLNWSWIWTSFAMIFLTNIYPCFGWQDTSSCKKGKFADCGQNNGYYCDNDSQCLYCNPILYDYNCETCRCQWGSLGFWLTAVGLIIVTFGCCIICCRFTKKRFWDDDDE